jgi:hypothetical protein
MDYFFKMYDKMIDSIVDTAELETTAGPTTTAQKCANCNVRNHDKSTCDCRCHFRSCGKCENEKCVIRSCPCDCHELGIIIDINQEIGTQAVVEESILEPQEDVSFIKEEEAETTVQKTIYGVNSKELTPTNKDINNLENPNPEESKPKLRMKKKKKGELVSYIFYI